MTVRLSLVSDLASLATLRSPADIVLFPELLDGGYEALRKGEGVHTPGDATLRRLRAFSKRSRTTCIAGSVALRGRTNVLTNTSLVYHRGRLIHRYDKIHLFRPADEPRLFRPGRSAKSFVISGSGWKLKAGIIICYDLRFPELTRLLAREGAEILFVPARWPLVRNEAWQSLLKARAIENQMVVVGCNARGKEGGYSYAFDPSGRLLLDTRIRPDANVHSVKIDVGSLRALRGRMRYLDDAVMLTRLKFPRGSVRRKG
ncbi:MAG: carbon-nitrogen family hydrolase [Bacteroidetes bacterium]|nr:carbon-nitrogen family hydrolase [Bacteroidota bacterium]